MQTQKGITVLCTSDTEPLRSPVFVQLKNMEGESISYGFRFYNQSLVTNVTEQTHRGLTMFISDIKPNTNVEGYTIVSL